MDKTVKHCKVCDAVKPAFINGVYGDGKTKRLIDEKGRYWNGRWCPDCNGLRVKTKMRELRAKTAKSKDYIG